MWHSFLEQARGLLILFSFFAAFRLLMLWRGRHKERDLNSFVGKLGLSPLGEDLPDGLSMKGSSLTNDYYVTESWTGPFRGTRIAVFLYSNIGPGDEMHRFLGWRVVAFEILKHWQPEKLHPQSKRGNQFEVSGNWLLCWQDSVVVAPDKLEGWCNEPYDQAAATAGS